MKGKKNVGEALNKERDGKVQQKEMGEGQLTLRAIWGAIWKLASEETLYIHYNWDHGIGAGVMFHDAGTSAESSDLET